MELRRQRLVTFLMQPDLWEEPFEQDSDILDRQAICQTIYRRSFCLPVTHTSVNGLLKLISLDKMKPHNLPDRLDFKVNLINHILPEC